jgi:transposase
MDMRHSLKRSQPGTPSSTPFGERDGVRGKTAVSPNGVTPEGPMPVVAPDPEVPEKKPRKRFTAAYKLHILKEADQCEEPGQIGVLLRKEGLYSSHLTTWRRQREEGSLQGLTAQKRGRKAKPRNPSAERIGQLEKENQRLKQQLQRAEIIIEAQKKISEILGIDQNPESSQGSN